MSLTNPNKVVTEERLNEYHKMILPYLGGNSMVACGGGYAPIGTVIAYMGTRAPSDFLICDGTVYNIADYTELADFFEAQFGSANFFGGDGAATFAVPDLRGEFLRGTGTNSHANQGSGANVGVHQDGTETPWLLSRAGTRAIYTSLVASGESTKNQDAEIGSSKAVGAGVNEEPWDALASTITSRPTNTSVLYCIKAKSQGNGYSLDEQIVGTWIDGKPIYQKTIQHTFTNNTSTQNITILHNISNLDKVVNISGIYFNSKNSYSYPISQLASGGVPPSMENAYDWAIMFSSINSDNILLTIGKERKSGEVLLTIQYTKTTDTAS
jgi:microcystin-dependent protein